MQQLFRLLKKELIQPTKCLASADSIKAHCDKKQKTPSLLLDDADDAISIRKEFRVLFDDTNIAVHRLLVYMQQTNQQRLVMLGLNDIEGKSNYQDRTSEEQLLVLLDSQELKSLRFLESNLLFFDLNFLKNRDAL